MAAFSNLHFIESGALLRRVSFFVVLRLQRWAGHVVTVARETAAATGEIVLFVWTILVLALALLIAAGFLV
jgi:hypothetical protein